MEVRVNSTLETKRLEEQMELRTSMPSALYDALSALVRRVYGSQNGTRVRTLMVTATRPDSGVSYISSCFATLVAGMLGTSLLIDGRAVLGLARRRVVPLRSDCTSVGHSRLSVLGKAEAAEITAHAQRRGESVRFVIDSLLNEFDYAIVDAPALSVSRAAQAISPHVDGVLLVVVPNETDIVELSAARKKLMSAGTHVLGAIYNTTLDHSDSPTGYTPCND